MVLVCSFDLVLSHYQHTKWYKTTWLSACRNGNEKNIIVRWTFWEFFTFGCLWTLFSTWILFKRSSCMVRQQWTRMDGKYRKFKNGQTEFTMLSSYLQTLNTCFVLLLRKISQIFSRVGFPRKINLVRQNTWRWWLKIARTWLLAQSQWNLLSLILYL